MNRMLLLFTVFLLAGCSSGPPVPSTQLHPNTSGASVSPVVFDDGGSGRRLMVGVGAGIAPGKWSPVWVLPGCRWEILANDGDDSVLENGRTGPVVLVPGETFVSGGCGQWVMAPSSAT